jgi:hypothetical protein
MQQKPQPTPTPVIKEDGNGEISPAELVRILKDGRDNTL